MVKVQKIISICKHDERLFIILERYVFIKMKIAHKATRFVRIFIRQTNTKKVARYAKIKIDTSSWTCLKFAK